MNASGILPNFLIIGAMRAGTTALARYLAAHHEAFVATDKEIHFFDRHFSRGLEWYTRVFSNAGGKKAVGEATPGYMYAAEAIPRMAATIPNARLIAILRNPVDRAYSHYWHNRALGREPLSFADAVAAEPRRLSTGQGVSGLRYSYLDRGRYLEQLVRVSQHYARDLLHVVIFEELRNDPVATFASICRFLSIDDRTIPPMVGQPINRFVAFRSGRLELVTRRLPPRLRRIVRRLNVRRSTYPPMERSVRALLQQQFAPDNLALAVWLGRDLSVWTEHRFS